MSVVLIRIVLFVVAGFVLTHGCPSAMKRRRRSALPDAVWVHERLAKFFGSQCTSMTKAGVNQFPSLQSVVDYVIRDTVWFQQVQHQCDKTDLNSEECWIEGLNYLLVANSTFLSPATECMRQWARNDTSSTQLKAISNSPRSSPLSSQESSFARCLSKRAQTLITQCPSLRRLEGSSIIRFLRDHYADCRYIPRDLNSNSPGVCDKLPTLGRNVGEIFQAATRKDGPLGAIDGKCDASIHQTSASNRDTDPCNSNYGGCDRTYGLCWPTGENTHFCTCRAGFEEDTRIIRRHTCRDVDECSESPCDENADCVNTVGSYECNCRCGYVLDYTGQHCLDASKIEGQCLVPRSCRRKNGGFFFGNSQLNSVPFSTTYSDNYVPDYSQFQFVADKYEDRRFANCECESGFEFNYCGFCDDINECFNSPCQGANSQCVNTEGSYYCTCINDYQIGPCGKRCYSPSQDVPQLCETPDLSSLHTAGIRYRTYNEPIILRNYRNCAPGTREGQTTVERYDLDNDGIDDVILTWVCSTGFGRQESSLKQYAEEEASWDPWSCWTVCKATCWGGLQTRVRLCQHGLPGVGGCAGSGSEKRNCYSGERCPYRIRKDVNSLTNTERNDLVQAMKKYKEDTSTRGFHNAASSHGWPFQCNRQSCCPHGAKVEFLSWHRTIVLYYEEGLVRYMNNKQLGIPYWNWLGTNKNPPSLGWDRFINGDVNPFSNMTVRIDRQGSMRTIQRDSVVFQDGLDFAEESWRDISLRKVAPHLMHEFAESTESGHGGPHISICGEGRQSDKCTISLASLDYAGFEPLFMMHHSQVDRLWAVAQKKLEDQGNTTWSVQTALEGLEPRSNFGRRQMPFGNSSLNAFPKVKAVNTMRDSYYYEELTGVKYDSVDFDGYPPVMGRSLRQLGTARLFVGHYFDSDRNNFYVNYYLDNQSPSIPCNRMTTADRIGGVLRMGTSRSFRLTIPHLTSFNVPGNIGLDRDLNIKACYTADPDCRERCPELTTFAISTMPSPNLVYYLPNTPVDINKFKWQRGQRMPSFYINLDAKSHWLYFYGSGAGNIRQVRNAAAYYSCNTRGSRPFRCSFPGGSACALPSGIYFLIDSSRSLCRNGLRMIAVSRLD